MGASRSNMHPPVGLNVHGATSTCKAQDCKSHFPYIAVPGILLWSLVGQTRHIEHDTSMVHSFVTGSHAPGTMQMHHSLCDTFGCFVGVLHFVNNE